MDTGLHTDTVRTFTASQRNASVKDTATTNRDKSSAKSSTTGRTKRTRKLTPEQEAKKKLDKEKKAKKLDKERKAKKLDKEKKAKRAAALRAKRKAQAEKEREVAALKRKRLAEKKKKLAEAKKAREAKKPKSAYITVLCSPQMSYSPISDMYTSHQPSSEVHERIPAVRSGDQETYSGGHFGLAQSFRGGEAGARCFRLRWKNGAFLTRESNVTGILRAC